MTLADAAAVMGGVLHDADPETLVTGTAEHNSQAVTPGGLFVAIAGARFDGHDFAEQAIHSGAAAVVATRPVGVPAIVVGDPEIAVGRLAAELVRRHGDLTIVGVTGSSGKTTTKDLIAGLLRTLGPTVGPPGSPNNELGFPCAVLKATAETRFLAMEYGSRGVGHIEYLCRIAQPRIAAVLNVGVAHLGAFGSADVIAEAKSELVAALPEDGLAILNADDHRVRAMAGRTKARVVLVGEAPDADIRAEDVTVDDRGRPSFTLVTPEGSAPVTLAVSGRHQVGNMLAVAAIGRELGMSTETLAGVLPGLRLVSARRMDVFDSGGVTVIDDSYNANPASMAAALRALADIGRGRRSWAVLGYMAELGDAEREGHLETGRLAAELGVSRVLAVSAEAAGIAEGAGGEAVLLQDQEAAIAVLRAELRPGDVVLVKGSRYRTWQVADALREGITA